MVQEGVRAGEGTVETGSGPCEPGQPQLDFRGVPAQLHNLYPSS